LKVFRLTCLKPYFWLVLLCLAIYLPGIATLPVLDRDSSHFAQATRQMLETGNYFQIRYQDITRYQKPPGINWLQALSVKAFSSSESNKIWPYRIPSLIGGCLSVLLTFAFARRFYQKETAFLAAALLACTLLLSIESHLAVIDASLLSSVVLMQGALWLIYKNSFNNTLTSLRGVEQRSNPDHSSPNTPSELDCSKYVHWKWPALFFASMAYGILLKGVTPLVGFLTILALCLKDRKWLKNLHLLWGITFLIIFTAAWLIGVSIAENSNYLVEMLHRDLLPKLEGGHESHGAPFGTHLFILAVTFWPASLFLYPLFIYAWKNRKTSDTAFLLAWIIPTWLFFELMPTKLPQYILPVFPALAILASASIMQWTTLATNVHKTIFRTLSILWLIVSAGLACAFIVIPYYLQNVVSYLSLWISAIIILFSTAAVVFIFKQSLKKSAYCLILGSLLSFSPAYHFLLPGLTPLWPSQTIAAELKTFISSEINDSHPLLSLGFEEPSLVFMLGTHRVKFIEPNKLFNEMKQNRRSWVLVDDRNQTFFLEGAKARGISLSPVKTIRAFNYSKGRWITLVLYSTDFKVRGRH